MERRFIVGEKSLYRSKPLNERYRLLPPTDQLWLYFSPALPGSEDCILISRKFRTDMLSG